MSLTVGTSVIPGVIIVEPAVFGDARGSFFEAWHAERYAAVGLPSVFVQDNVSRSARSTLRGLHLQEPHGQGKLVQVLEGEVFDVALDVRVGSPTFGKWEGFALSHENRRQVYLPPGIAHGFCVVSEFALFAYKCTDYYQRDVEFGVAWNDPDVGIAWPVALPLLSPKDAAAPRLAEIPTQRLPKWPGP
jgi:dTDP-4-dehydrorhamnose 3,5-epimerase